ncbi:MAG: UvrD-helicase domain-containing protein [Acidobacteria bacterium]|nr:UvrD-helicase domain-containing protein [Acidobacteriota bacterium]
MTLPDAEDRIRAVTLFDRNIVVTAGAGTGKTALLVERVLNLIGSDHLAIGNLAAITFTEKAAAELQRRMATGLDQLRSLAVSGDSGEGSDAREGEAVRSYRWLIGEAGQSPDAIAKRALDALVDLDSATVSTIHSFCAGILRRHPREAMVDPVFTVDDGLDLNRIFDEEWSRFLDQELGGEASRLDLWERVLAVPDGLEIVRAIGRSLSSLSIPDAAIASDRPYRGATIEAILGGRIRTLSAAIEDLLGRSNGMNGNMRDFLTSTRAFLEAAIEGGLAAMREARATRSLDDYLGWGTPSPGGKLSGASPEEVKETAEDGRRVIKMLARVEEETVGALVEAARPLALHCRERALAAGSISFDGLLRLTRDMLSRSPVVRRDLTGRYRTLLVDEFQDTDPLQYEILFFLAGEGAGDDPWGLPLEPGRLFIVGDPKQSIYRFRGADIEAYERAVHRVCACGGERLTLSASFRAPQEVVEPINRLFAAWMTAGNGTGRTVSPEYEPIVSALGSAGGEERVEIWSIPDAGRASDRRSAEGGAIASFIARDAPSRPVAGEPGFSSYAILMRALTQAGFYVRALRRAGIPFLVEGGREFYERREVADLLAFLRAVANPHDGAAVLAVMRGPLGAAPDAELAQFAAAGGRLNLADGGIKDYEAFPNIRRALALLRTFRDRTVGLASDEVVRAVLTTTPLGILHAAHFEGAQRIANLRKIVSRAGEIARGGFSLERTLIAIDEEFQGARAEGESPLADETVNAVRILSVHKAKGLQYPVVIVPDLGRAPNVSRSQGHEVDWNDDREGFLAVRLEDGIRNIASVDRSLLDHEHERAEEKRVLYVACTRTRERLILINSRFSRHPAPWRDALAHIGYILRDGPPEDGTLTEGVRHRRIAPAPVRPASRRSPREDPIWAHAAARLRDASASARAAVGSPIRWPAGGGDLKLAAEDGREEEAPTARRRAIGTPDAAREAGTVIHRALERWDFNDPERLRIVAQEEILSAVAATGRPASGTGDLSHEIGRLVEEIVAQFLATDLPGRLRGLQVLGREVPLLYRDGAGITWIGAIDLVYRERDGTIVAADYKTDRAEGGTKPEERYADQMRIYLEALRRGVPGAMVRGELLLLRSGTVIPL